MTKAEALELVKTVWDRYWTYHNWKETLAWGGVLFYLAFAGLLLSPILQRIRPGVPMIGAAVLPSAALVVVGALVFVYVGRQQSLTTAAARVNGACACLWMKLLKLREDKLPSDDEWNIEPMWHPDFGKILPTFILREAEATPTPPSRTCLAFLARALIIVASLFSLAAIWTPWIIDAGNGRGTAQAGWGMDAGEASALAAMVTVLVTAVLAGLTGWYVVLTRRLVACNVDL
ncbi:MAG: hypothetical protein KAY32_18365, partial [Candidatus Eisenbacteria sp.]|nr:hypothetical protein [Candidatus Eisenbacteria bacterium]